MSAEESIDAAEIQFLQDVKNHRSDAFSNEHFDRPRSNDGVRARVREEARRLQDELGLTWYAARRVSIEMDLPPTQVGRALMDLVDAGEAERRGGKRNPKYHLAETGEDRDE